MAENTKLHQIIRKIAKKKSIASKQDVSLDLSVNSSQSLDICDTVTSPNTSSPAYTRKRSLTIHDPIIHAGNGRLVQLDKNGVYTSSEDLSTSKDGTPKVCLRKSTTSSSQRSKDKSLRHTVHYQESPLTTHDLIGRATLSSKDLVFGIPRPPERPPRSPQKSDRRLRKAFSTPNINKKGCVLTTVETEENRHQNRKKRWSMLYQGYSDEESSDSDDTTSDQSYMDWSDDEASVGSSSTSSPTARDEDIYQNLDYERDLTRAHQVAKELLTSEESYVKKLAILNTARNKTKDILGNEVAKEMFPYINSIYVLHKENMLPHLKERLAKWNSKPQVGDIMKTFAPFLKVYTDYVKNFDDALKLVDAWNTRSVEFAKMLMSLPSNGASLNLKIQIKSHMLEPIQRVPRYRLLLQQYMKEIREDSPERADLQVALTSVSQAASHFEERMKHGVMMEELTDLQRQVDCPINLLATGRELVRQGKIGKVNATTGRVVSRYIFLFNDLFLLCSEQTLNILGLSPKYKCRQLMEVEGMQITEGDNLDVPHTFYVKTKKKAVELCANTEQEKDEWQQVLWKVVGDKMRQKLAKTNTINRRRTMMLRAEGPLGKEAPVWVHNSQASMCMACATEFKGFKKKHHCRACGSVLCHRCSSHTARIEYDDFREHRVCDECYLLLEERAQTVRRESIYKAKAREICVQRGYLQLSSDRGKSWQRRWFEVHEGGSLYCFKLQQDIIPLSHVSGSVPQMVTLDDASKAVHLELSNRKSYLLKEGSTEKLQRWIDALTIHS